MVIRKHSRSVVIVDDDEQLRGALHGLLKGAGFRARAFASAEEFLNSGQQHRTSCLITDLRIPGMSGLELQARLYGEQITIPIIFVTGHGDERTRMQASQSGAVGFLAKPFDDELLLDMVRAALELWTWRPRGGSRKSPPKPSPGAGRGRQSHSSD